MTYQELAERDLKNARRSLVIAYAKSNVTSEELGNLRRLVEFRKAVCELINKEYGNDGRKTNVCKDDY